MQPKKPSDEIVIRAMLLAVRQSADVVCDRWSLTLILAALLGARRFGDFVRESGLEGRLVTQRLRQLEASGIIARAPLRDRSLRLDYRLTAMGMALLEPIIQMASWEARWSPDPGARGLDFVRGLFVGRPLPQLRCQACGIAVTARDVEPRVDPALLREIPAKQTVRRRSTVDSRSPRAVAPLLGESLDVLGDKWTIEIVNCAFLRVRLFGDFRAHLGISGNILSDRLGRLVEMGLLEKARGDIEGRARAGYWLTEKGRDFYGTLMAMQVWADTWLSDRILSPLTLVHRTCAHELQPAPALPTPTLIIQIGDG